MASGVLVIGVGNGTRALEYLQGLRKVYRATLVLGIETDSEDTTGVITAEGDASGVTESALRELLTDFQGELQQVPPMVSALKVRGQRLYELARRGETVHREPRPITVYSAELLEFTPGRRAQGELRIECSAGTYVRSLCRDIGQRLGCGGAMGGLVREAVGPFRVAEAVPLDLLGPDTPLVPLAEALSHLPCLRIDEAESVRLAQGQFITAPEETPDGPVRVLGPSGDLLAVATVRSHREARLLAPEKVFVSGDAADYRS